MNKAVVVVVVMLNTFCCSLIITSQLNLCVVCENLKQRKCKTAILLSWRQCSLAVRNTLFKG